MSYLRSFWLILCQLTSIGRPLPYTFVKVLGIASLPSIPALLVATGSWGMYWLTILYGLLLETAFERSRRYAEIEAEARGSARATYTFTQDVRARRADSKKPEQ